MKIGVVKTDFNALIQKQSSSNYDSNRRKPSSNCEILYEVSSCDQSSILEDYIIELDKTSLADQKQMPNPMLVTTWVPTIIFTAWYMQDYASSEVVPQGISNNHKSVWYPSVFFYCLEKLKVVWEIYGAEVYLGSTSDRKVYYLSNDIWSSMTEDEVEDIDPQRNSLPSYIRVAHWKMKPHNNTQNRSLIAPKMIEKQKYRLTYSGSINSNFSS